jgi:hypothetical protein
MTGRQLLVFLNSLTPHQLDDFDLSVSEGCDENGNAEFFTLNDYCVVGGGVVDAAADGVLEDEQPVLLFGSPE